MNSNKPISINLLSEESIITPAFSKNNVGVGLFSSDEYSPYCGILIQSIICHSRIEMNYDIIILEREISDYNKKLISELANNYANVSIRFVNVSLLSEKLHVIPRGHFTIDNVIKIFFFTNCFSLYSKIVSTDSDLVFERDVADLYSVSLENKSIAAVPDLIMQTLLDSGHEASGEMQGMPVEEYLVNFLGLDKADRYLNTGVCVFNLDKARKNNIFQKLLCLVNQYNFWFLEQDALNRCFSNDIVELSGKWNVHIAQKQESVLDCFSDEKKEKIKKDIIEPYIMHFPGPQKPWNAPNIPYSEVFFKYARMTPWYEAILLNVAKRQNELLIANSKIARSVRMLENKKSVFSIAKQKGKKVIKPFVNVVLPKESFRRNKVKSFYKRITDKNLKAARRNMLNRILANKKLSQFPETNEYINCQKIRAYKGKYKGQRCFIIGTGPSLKIDQLSCLKNELTFSLNSIYKIFDQTDWRPTFYFNNDIMLNYKMKVPQNVRYNDLKKCLKKYRFENAFISSSQYDNEILEINPNVIFLPTVDYLYQFFQPKIPYWGDKCDKKVQAYGTTVYLIMQLVVYMGFSEVYLLGMDCDYTSEKKHIYKQSSYEDNLYVSHAVSKSLEDALIKGYSAIKYYADKKKIKIYNASQGGKLELFERVSFEDLFREKIS